MVSKKEKLLRTIALWLRKTTGVSPNGLSFIRIFLTPWIALLIIETIDKQRVDLAVFILVLYAIAVLTDFFDGPLARAMRSRGHLGHSMGYGGVLDRISDKLLVVFSLIPFGMNIFIIAIIIGESLLTHQAVNAKSTKKKQATQIGKIKMLLQTFLMPILLVNVFYENEIFSILITSYMLVTVLFTTMSVVSHYRK